MTRPVVCGGAGQRALSDLAHKLLDAAVGDIEAVTHKPAHLRA